MFKKVVSLLLCITMLLTLGACSKDKETSGSGDQVTLTLWSIATESDGFHHAFKQAVADYEAAHPNVKIKLETFENESYKTKIKSAVSANELPDIFFTWGGGFSKSFVESGKVLQIDKYYTDEYKSQLSPVALANATYDGKLYGVTYVTPVSVLYYNKKILTDNGLTAPTTWDEFVNVCQTLKNNGITPIGISVKDTWVLAMTHDALTLKSAGPTKVVNALTKQGQSYNDPDFLASATKVKELVDMGAFVEGATGLTNDEASALFYNGTVAMYITGSWMGANIQKDAANPADFDAVPVPVLGNNAKATDFMGGASDTLMVSASTKYPDIAGDAVFEISRSISKYAYLDGAGVAGWAVDYDDKDINPITKKIADYAKNATSFTLWFDTLMEADDAGEYLALLQELYMGSITPQEFVEAMDAQLSK